MSDDDKVLLKEIISQERSKSAPKMSADDYFEIFSAEQILKDRSHDLDQDQVRSGVVGGGGDGGVDTFYVFVNRRLLRDDSDLNHLKDQQQVDIELVITQSKNASSFTEKAITALSDFVENCLRLAAKPTAVSLELYSQTLRDGVERFHNIFKASLTKRPTVTIAFYYASLGEQIHQNVHNRKDMLLAKTQEAFSTAAVSFNFVGAKELLRLAYKTPTQTFALESTLHIPEGASYVCLVRVGKFFDFIDDNGVPRGHLFEANVRDYQGDVTVNREIALSLAAQGSEQFWWLNNGITIIAADVSSSGYLFSVTNPLIVNGLQTSYELHKYFLKAPRDDPRMILVRLIKATDEQSIDRIIKATNSQTKIPAAWLHATEEIHRKIETAMKTVGLYYDRRKNFHRNQGVAPRLIVSIPYLSQALAAIVLQKPDDARARPTTVAERHYKQLFNDTAPMELYVRCAQILKRMDDFLDDSLIISRGHKLNLSFFLAMYAACAVLRSAKPQRQRIAAIDMSLLDDKFLQTCLGTVYSKYRHEGGNDAVAKGPHLTQFLKNDLAKRYSKVAPEVAAK